MQLRRINFERIFLNLSKVVNQFFSVCLLPIFILCLMETLFPGFVGYSFGLGRMPYSVFVGVFIVVFIIKEANYGKKEGGLERLDYVISVILGLVGGVAAFYKIGLPISIRLITSVIIGFLIALLPLTFLTSEDEGTE